MTDAPAHGAPSPVRRRPLIAGNWKLHNTVQQSTDLASAVASGAATLQAEVVVAPVFTALHAVGLALQHSTAALAAQDTFWEDKGAFTGEVSVSQLRDVGCTYVIVGHSERRQYFGETDEIVRRKIAAAVAGGLSVIACVGESLAERDAGEALPKVTSQVRAALLGLSPHDMARVVIAYEPVWAIGTGRTARPEDAQQVHAEVRKTLVELFGRDVAGATRILYGGSVNDGNAATLLREPDIDGALVGGASLSAEKFLAIVRAAG